MWKSLHPLTPHSWITKTYLFKPDKHIFSQDSGRPCFPLGPSASMSVKPLLPTSKSTSRTRRVVRPSWEEQEIRALTCTCWAQPSEITQWKSPKLLTNIFQAALMSANQRKLWWNTTTHPAGVSLTQDRERQSLKTSSLLGQAYQWIWYKNNSRKKIHNTWAPLATAEGPHIHTREDNAPIPRSSSGPVTSSHTVRKHQSCLFKDSWSVRENLYRSNRKVSSHFKQG